jgi:hypothetical protein
VCFRQIKHGKEFSTVRMMKTHSKDIQHGRHLKKNMTKNYTRQTNKVEHGEANIHGKESRHVAARPRVTEPLRRNVFAVFTPKNTR